MQIKSAFGHSMDLFIVLTALLRCDSFNCLSSGVCGKPDSEPRHFNAWVYVLVSFGIFGGEFSVQLSQLLGAHILSRNGRCHLWVALYTQGAA
jgi:hypothetical protein